MSDDVIRTVRLVVHTKHARVVEADEYGDVDTPLAFRAAVKRLGAEVERDLIGRELLGTPDLETRLGVVRAYAEGAIRHSVGRIDAQVVLSMLDDPR